MIREEIEKIFADEYMHFKGYIKSRFSTINEYDAEDIIQQTIVRLLSKSNDSLSINNISSYFYSALRNGAIDHIRKSSHEISVSDDFDTADTKTVEDLVLLLELKQVLYKCIIELPQKARFVFVEIEIKGRSYKEVSKQTGIKLGTLLSIKSRATNKLKDMLESYISVREIK